MINMFNRAFFTINMKKIFLSLFLLLIACMSVTVSAQNRSKKAQNPLDYPYYIYGEQQVVRRDAAVLNNVQFRGFSFPELKRGDSFKGERDDNEKILYIFNEISTDPVINLKGKNLQYWRMIEDGVWMSDIEAGTGTADRRMDKDAYFVLVLDCSSSLGNDFELVKNAAESFVNELYGVSDQGNIRVGIVCFSSMENTKISKMFSLTPENKYEILGFIGEQNNRLSAKSNATAMYYALNEAMEKLLPNVKKLNEEKYEGIHFITFTDGLDNTSQLESENLFTINKVSEYVVDKLSSTMVNGDNIDSWVIGVEGEDVQEVQLNLMKNQLKNLASKEEQFKWYDSPSQVVDAFTDILENLTKRWQNLYCTSALNFEGPVCWTYGDLEPVSIVKPVKETLKPVGKSKEMFFGLNLGVGTDLTAGIDYAYPLTKKFGLGGYLSIGCESIYDEGSVCAKVGLFATSGNHEENKIKFLYGLGGHFGEILGVDFRFGMEFRNGLYLLLDPYFGSGYDGGGGGVTINIGYNLGKLFKR